jgi:hypothetical protein
MRGGVEPGERQIVKPIVHAIVCVAVVAGGASAALADVVVLGAIKDNTLFESASGSLSNGAGSAMFAGRNAAATDSIRRAVLAFDIAAAVPAGATINDVTLTLHNSASNVTNDSVALHSLLADWGEGNSVAPGNGGGGAPTALGDATWVHRFFPGSFWAASGGDYVASPSATQIVGAPGFYSWSSMELAADVQGWLDAPATNFGWIVIGNEAAPSSAKRFGTREATDPSQRPALTIDFKPIPEPSSLAILMPATAILMRRSRRRASI